jgi:SP family facilitated glucose transporter-like MFS transporter 1
MMPVGGLFGALYGGRASRKYGRKATLLYNTFVILGASLLMGLSVSPMMFGIARALVGIGAGVATATVSTYIAEISPIRYRGTLGTMSQMSIVVAILVAQLLGLPLSTVSGWRWLVAGSFVPAVLQCVFLMMCVETPSYLVSQGMVNAAERSLQRLRGTTDVTMELNSIIAGQNTMRESTNLSITKLLTSKVLRKALIVSLAAQFAQQFSGINGVLQYSTSIFEDLFPGQAQIITAGIGGINLLTTVLAVYLMDRAGRRVLLLTSQVGVGLSLFLVTFAMILNVDYVSVALVVAIVALFAIGLGPIPWLILPELFPTYAIGPAASICVTVNWLSNFLVSLLFKPLFSAMGPYAFLPFSVLTFALTAITFMMLPETKGRSLDEIVALLQ